MHVLFYDLQGVASRAVRAVAAATRGAAAAGAASDGTTEEWVLPLDSSKIALGTPLVQRQALKDLQDAVRSAMAGLLAKADAGVSESAVVEVTLLSKQTLQLTWPAFHALSSDAHAAVRDALRASLCGDERTLPSLLVCSVRLLCSARSDGERHEGNNQGSGPDQRRCAVELRKTFRPSDGSSRRWVCPLP